MGAGGGEVGADGDGLLAHPLGAEADGREVVDVLAEAALRGDLREHGEDARVVDAGPEVEHRRDADGLHDLAQAGAGVVEDLGAQVAGLGAGGGRAAGHHDHDVVGDEALDHLDDALVLGDAHVVAADDAGEAAHAAGDDGVVERPERAAVEAALHVVEVLVAEAGDERLVEVGDVDGTAVGVVGDRHAHDLAGRLGGAVLVELDVRRAGDLGLGRGRDQLGVEALGERPSACMMHCTSTTMTSTAPVRTASSCCRKLPATGMPCRMRISLAGAADAGEVDALRAGGLGLGDELRVAGGLDQHRRERRLVAVHDDVDLVVLEHAEVDLDDERRRRAEEDVADVGAQHRAAPAVGQGAAQRRLEDVLGVEVDALVRAVQHLDDLAVDGARGDPQLAPLGLALGGRALGVDDLAVGLAELGEGHVGHVEGDLVDLAAAGGDAEVVGDDVQLLLVLDLVPRGLAQGDGAQRHRHVATVVGVGGHAAGHLPREVAGGDGAHVGAADAGLLLGVLADQAARAHRADAAAGAGLADGTGLHGVRARERGVDPQPRHRQHLEGGGVDTLRGYRLHVVVGLFIHEATLHPRAGRAATRARPGRPGGSWTC